MYFCKKCEKTFEKRYSYIGHCSTHSRIKKEKTKSEKHICRHCNKEYDKGVQLGGHSTFCEFNPERKTTIDKIALSNTGKTPTEETRLKISNSRKRYLDENPGNIPYLLNHSSKESYPESLMKNILLENEIFDWVQEYPFKRFSLDFAFIDKKINIEIDGSLHDLDKVKIKDLERTRILNENGWTVIRFTDKEVKSEQEKIIKIIRSLLN